MCTILGHPFCILVVFHGQLRQTCESLWRLVLGMTSRQELREPALGRQVWSSPMQTAQVWEIWVLLCTIRGLRIPRMWNLQTKNVVSSKNNVDDQIFRFTFSMLCRMRIYWDSCCICVRSNLVTFMTGEILILGRLTQKRVKNTHLL